jgi:mono/diheme cytochrome c family protein
MRRLMKCAVISGLIGSCVLTRAFSNGQPPTTAPSGPTTMAGEVHRLDLPQIDPQLPPGEGRNVVQIQCAVCHTPHYILNQPPFSRKVWTAEVAKMQTAYGAPIPEADATKIVNYLVAVRGAQPN